MLPGSEDTIAAIATAAGRSAVALVRVSGKRARDIAGALGAPDTLVPRAATRCQLRHPTTHEPLDDALVTLFVAPHSFTGEDVVEISTHGGRVVPLAVLAACLTAGAREALPGEFTRRALMNGRIDLLQAEAIADLVDARTRAMQKLALAQLDGGLSRRLTALRHEIIALEVLLAYDIDFPEEDDGPIAPARISSATDKVLAQLSALIATAPRAAMIRDGALVVIAGPPNAGKSSLFNALLGEARALVTEVPGTTRDAIEVLLDTPGLPIRLVDTAGLRQTDDLVERLGIEVSERYLSRAQVVLACAERDDDLARTVHHMQALTSVPVIAVLTKCDQRREHHSDAQNTLPVRVSAERGDGLELLLDTIRATIQSSDTDVGALDTTPITRERHRLAISTALSEVELFSRAWREQDVPATIAAVHLRSAAHVLDELVGTISVDDVLDRLFREFCVGK